MKPEVTSFWVSKEAAAASKEEEETEEAEEEEDEDSALNMELMVEKPDGEQEGGLMTVNEYIIELEHL